MEPLIDFLTRYSPAIGMMVQYEVTPTALIWGSLKALLEVSSKVSMLVVETLTRCVSYR